MTVCRVAPKSVPGIPIRVANVFVPAVAAIEVDMRRFELTRAWLSGQLGDVALWVVEQIISSGDPRGRLVASNMLRRHR